MIVHEAKEMRPGDELSYVRCSCELLMPSLICSTSPRIHSTYRRSHILIVPSSLPVTNHLPSLWKDIEVTFIVWPSKVTTWKFRYLIWTCCESILPTGSEAPLAISYMLTFLWIAAARSRLLTSINRRKKTIYQYNAHSGEIARRLTC